MNLKAFIMEPLQGKTSLARVFWLYSIVGSLVYGAIEFLLNPENALLMRLYEIGSIVFLVYVTVATYKCAANCKSKAIARLARVSAIITMLLIPLIAYVDLTGSITIASLLGEQLPE
jgi:ABC-type uncharacterized transport system permease subunit